MIIIALSWGKHGIVFTPEMALTAAAIIPVLALAVIVEVRNLRISSPVQWRRLRVLVVVLGVLTFADLMVLLGFGARVVTGVAAIVAWCVAGVEILALLVILVLAICANLKSSESDQATAGEEATHRSRGWNRP